MVTSTYINAHECTHKSTYKHEMGSMWVHTSFANVEWNFDLSASSAFIVCQALPNVLIVGYKTTLINGNPKLSCTGACTHVCTNSCTLIIPRAWYVAHPSSWSPKLDLDNFIRLFAYCSSMIDLQTENVKYFSNKINTQAQYVHCKECTYTCTFIIFH